MPYLVIPTVQTVDQLTEVVLFSLGDTSRLGKGQRVEVRGRVFEIQDVWRGPLGALPAMLVEGAGDPTCRTFSGVVVALQAERGAAVQAEETVSALVLRQLGSGVLVHDKQRRIEA